MKKQTVLERAKKTLNEIRSLYRQIISTGCNDREYVKKLVRELLEYQKPDGSFSAADEWPTDGDAVVDFYYMPTYYGTAALMHSMVMDNNEPDKIMKESLVRALMVAKQKMLIGHGFDAKQQQLDALRIFKDAGLYEWISRFDDPANSTVHEFCEMIRKIISGYRKAVLEGRTHFDWAVDFKEAFEKEISDYEESLIPYVWYACYGSNLSSARFQRYLNDCNVDVSTIESRFFTASGNLYFAAGSSEWGSGKGVAFYDETARGTVLMRLYKISRSQFADVQSQEGQKYTRKVMLGTVEDMPVYTFTSLEKRTDLNAPSQEYVHTIMDGLKETFPDMSETVQIAYLFKHGGISDDARQVLAFIRKAPHAASIREIAESSLCLSLTRTKDSIKYLEDLGLIRRDARSRRAGLRAGDPETMFFTEPEKRDIVDLVVYNMI